MNQQTINPDEVCQRAVKARLEIYRAKEMFETVLKNYNDHMDGLMNVIGLIKNRILELEAGAAKKDEKKK